MTQTRLEHINLTVTDPDVTARQLCALFGWQILWKGKAIHHGYSVHVGTGRQYLALYTHPEGVTDAPLSTYQVRNGLNHVGIVVDDLDGAECRILAAGYETYSHGDYEPGRRFYYRDSDGIEFEVVSYREEPAA